jgi:hypothetical protein
MGGARRLRSLGRLGGLGFLGGAGRGRGGLCSRRLCSRCGLGRSPLHIGRLDQRCGVGQGKVGGQIDRGLRGDRRERHRRRVRDVERLGGCRRGLRATDELFDRDAQGGAVGRDGERLGEGVLCRGRKRSAGHDGDDEPGGRRRGELLDRY